jgi:hypothetical protein
MRKSHRATGVGALGRHCIEMPAATLWRLCEALRRRREQTAMQLSENIGGSFRTCPGGVRARLPVWLSPALLQTAGLGLVLLALSCGGGGGSASSAFRESGQTISVTISPRTTSLGFGARQQFTATVTGSTNTAVTWSVNNIAGGNSQVGTISTTGLYTAALPAALPPPFDSVHEVAVNPSQQTPGVDIALTPLVTSTTLTVTATSKADATRSASAQVTITPLSLVAVGTCGTTQCVAGGTGVEVKQGEEVTLFLVGEGIAAGTSFDFSGPAGDVVVSSVKFVKTDSGKPAADVTVSISPSAQPGARNIMVTNSVGELSAFAGGLLIQQGP